MPAFVKIVDDAYIVVHYEGKIILDDFIKTNDYIYSEIDEKLSKFQIVDLVAATSTDLSTEDLRMIAAQDLNAVEKLQSIVIAVVAPRDLAFGLSRMWSVFADTPSITTSVFKELNTARDWIMRMRKKLV